MHYSLQAAAAAVKPPLCRRRRRRLSHHRTPHLAPHLLQASNTPVGLNVGGQVFWTTRTTLTSTTGHILHRIFDDGQAGGMQGTTLRDEQGLVFIDR